MQLNYEYENDARSDRESNPGLLNPEVSMLTTSLIGHYILFWQFFHDILFRVLKYIDSKCLMTV